MTDSAITLIVSAVTVVVFIMILAFGPLATVQPADVAALAWPLFLAFVFGVAGIAIFAGVVGKLLGFSVPMSIAIGLTSLYGFPGTMILSQEAARGGKTPQEVAAIEGEILPKMIIAGFSTVTITSVIVTSIIAAGIVG